MALAAVIVLRKNASVKVLDVLVPIMAGCYFLITIFLLIKNAALLPSVFQRIFEEAFGIRQVVAGGFGAVLMQGRQARPVFQRGGLRLRPLCRRRRGCESSCQGRAAPGAGRVY